ncbi:MAG TPA: hypothetical protein VJ140_09340 [Actinomycetota bacterium]|nr:hypothetical protein [Actinomycetota bacterium]
MPMCADGQAARGHGGGPVPVMTLAEMRESLDLPPTWALEQKATANRQMIVIMRERLAAGQARGADVPGAGGWPGWSDKPRPAKR